MAEAAIAGTKFMRALNFTDADLKANREGAMSARQISMQRWQGALFSLWFGGCGAFGIWAALVLILIVLDPPDGMPQGVMDTLCSLAGIVMSGIVGPVLVFMSVFQFRQMRADTGAGKVEAVSGEIKRKSTYVGGRGDGMNYELLIGGKTLTVSYWVYQVFADGAAYHVYITPVSGAIMSAERIVNPAGYNDEQRH